MSDERSSLPTIGGCLAGAALLVGGISRANKNNTNTWFEMLNILKDICLWVFAVLFALFIAFVIYHAMKATLEKVQGAFVAWEKSSQWCDSIEKSFQGNKASMENLDGSLMRHIFHTDSLESEIRRLKTDFEELKKVTGFGVKETEVNAENEITGND